MTFTKDLYSGFRAVICSVTTIFVASVILPSFLLVSDVHAAVSSISTPANILKVSEAYSLPVLKGLRIDPMDPLKMEFIIDKGQISKLSEEVASKLIRHFLAALTIPDENIWVNLSPYEQDRIIPEALGVTEMGKELLEQDYMLKQLSASLTHPDTDLGKDYWGDVHSGALAPDSTFNKIWIMPAVADVFENKDHAIITEAKLKVMLEEDYLAQKNNAAKSNDIAADAMKERILPVIEDEVNNGSHFATLRQIYHSQILATWFKKKFSESFYGDYINQQKMDGVDTVDLASKDEVFDLYVDAFKKGVYNFIKKERDPVTDLKVKRRYFSGGYTVKGISDVQNTMTSAVTAIDTEALASELIGMDKVSINLAKTVANEDYDFADQKLATAASAIKISNVDAITGLPFGTMFYEKHKETMVDKVDGLLANYTNEYLDYLRTDLKLKFTSDHGFLKDDEGKYVQDDNGNKVWGLRFAFDGYNKQLETETDPVEIEKIQDSIDKLKALAVVLDRFEKAFKAYKVRLENDEINPDQRVYYPTLNNKGEITSMMTSSKQLFGAQKMDPGHAMHTLPAIEMLQSLDSLLMFIDRSDWRKPDLTPMDLRQDVVAAVIEGFSGLMSVTDMNFFELSDEDMADFLDQTSSPYTPQIIRAFQKELGLRSNGESQLFTYLLLNFHAKLDLEYLCGRDHLRMLSLKGEADVPWNLQSTLENYYEILEKLSDGILKDVDGNLIKIDWAVQSEIDKLVAQKYHTVKMTSIDRPDEFFPRQDVTEKEDNFQYDYNTTPGLNVPVSSSQARKAGDATGSPFWSFISRPVRNIVMKLGLYKGSDMTEKPAEAKFIFEEATDQELILSSFKEVVDKFFAGNLITAPRLEKFKRDGKYIIDGFFGAKSEEMTEILEKAKTDPALAIREMQAKIKELRDPNGVGVHGDPTPITAADNLNAELMESIIYYTGQEVAPQLIEQTKLNLAFSLQQNDLFEDFFAGYFNKGAKDIMAGVVANKRTNVLDQMDAFAINNLDKVVAFEELQKIIPDLAEFVHFDPVFTMINANESKNYQLEFNKEDQTITVVPKSSSSLIRTSNDLKAELDQMLAVTHTTYGKVDGELRAFVHHVNNNKPETAQLIEFVSAAKAVEDAYLADLSKLYTTEQAIALISSTFKDQAVAAEMATYAVDPAVDRYKLYTEVFNKKEGYAAAYEAAVGILKDAKRAEAFENTSKKVAVEALLKLTKQDQAQAEALYTTVSKKIGASSAVIATSNELQAELDKMLAVTRTTYGKVDGKLRAFVHHVNNNKPETAQLSELVTAAKAVEEAYLSDLSKLYTAEQAIELISPTFDNKAVAAEMATYAVDQSVDRYKLYTEVFNTKEGYAAAYEAAVRILKDAKRAEAFVNTSKDAAVEALLNVAKHDQAKAEAIYTKLAKKIGASSSVTEVLKDLTATKLFNYLNTASTFNELTEDLTDVQVSVPAKIEGSADRSKQIKRAIAYLAVKRQLTAVGTGSVSIRQYFDYNQGNVIAALSDYNNLSNEDRVYIANLIVNNDVQVRVPFRYQSRDAQSLVTIVNAYAVKLTHNSKSYYDQNHAAAKDSYEANLSVDEKISILNEVITANAEKTGINTVEAFTTKVQEAGFTASSGVYVDMKTTETQTFDTDTKGGVDLSVSSALTVASGSLPIDMPQYSLADIDGLSFMITLMDTVKSDIRVALAK